MDNLLFMLSLLLWTCASAKLSDKDNINEFLFLEDRNFEFVDLTNTFYLERPGLKSGRICVSGSHNSSHQYPRIYQKLGGKVVGNIPLNNLILPLILVDFSGKINGDSDFILQKYHLDYFLNNYFGRTYQPCLIVFKFGWTDYNNINKFNYYEVEENNTVSHPGISEDVARWIIQSYKNVVGIGVDTPSVDPSGFSEDAPAFKALTDAGVYVMENVKLSQYLPDAMCTAIVSPLKMAESCSPYRLMAICPKSRMEPRDFPLHHL